MKPTYALLLLASTLFVSSCQFNRDQAFQTFFEGFQEKVKEEPLLRAFIEKRLAFDSMLIAFNHNKADSLLAYAQEGLNQLQQFPNERLSPDLYSYSQNTGDFLKLLVKHISVDQIHHTDPGFYDPTDRLKFLLKNGTPREWIKELASLNNNYNTAIQLLQPSDTSRSSIAEQQALQVYKLLTNQGNIAAITSSATEEQQAAILTQLQAAKLSCKSFIGFARSLGFESREAIARQAGAVQK